MLAEPVRDVMTEPVRDVLTSGLLAHLVTLNPDGTPQVSCVWIGIDGNEIVSGHLGPAQKLRNVRRDPRVALSVEMGGKNCRGLANYLVIEGTGRVTEGGAPDLLRRLARTYLGPGKEFAPLEGDPPAGYVLHIRPKRVRGPGAGG